MPLNLAEYSKIRRVAQKFCRKMQFYGEEDDFASFAVALAWQKQGPINYRFAWFGWLRERYCTVNSRRDEDVRHGHDAAISYMQEDEQNRISQEARVLGAQAIEPQCEDWSRLAREIKLRPHTVEYAIFMLFFNLGYTPKEIAHITGYTRMNVYTLVKAHTRLLSVYYELPMIHRRTNRFT